MWDSYVKLGGMNIYNNILISNYLWMKVIIILTKDWMITITREHPWSYMMLVREKITSADVYMLVYGCV